MKKMKRFFATLVAVMLMASLLAVPASAAQSDETGDRKINISGAAGHEFKAYQIFKGTMETDSIVLSDAEWGDGVNPVTLVPELKADGTIGSFFSLVPDLPAGASDEARAEWLHLSATAVAQALESNSWQERPHTLAFAEVISQNLGDHHEGNFSNGTYTISNLPAGYYFVQDTTQNMENDAYSRYMIQLTKDANATVNIKKDIPTLKKFVSETTGIGTEKALSAGPGNVIYFTLTAKMHTRIADFNTYPLTLTDTLPDGMTFGKLEQIFVNNTLVADADSTTTSVRDISDADAKATAPTPESPALTISIPDAKTVIKAGTNNQDANSTDTISVVFSVTLGSAASLELGNPGNVNKATMTFPNNPNAVGTSSTATTVESADTTATVFTYQLKLTKEDSANSNITLPGAEFYIHFTDNAGNVKYLVADSEGNITGVAPVTVPGEIPSGATKFVTGNDGTFIVKGLREREYFLTEFKAPTNYNKIKTDQTVTIDATFGGQVENHLILQTLTATPTGTFTTVDNTNMESGLIEITVTNNQGATLPQTGGMGTTIFYVAGAILMIGAGAVLATKKRTQK